MATKEQKEINQKFEEQINSLVQDIRTKNGIQGPAGKVGPQGPPGVPGATYNYQGVFRNLGRVDMVMDRTVEQANTGNSRVYLNTPEQSTNQLWTLQQDGWMRNQWGQCLTGKKNPDGSADMYSVFMDDCKENEQGQKWIFDNVGRMQWRGGEDTCLSFKELDSVPEGTTNMISKGFPMEGQPKGKFMMVSIDSCGKDVNSSLPRQKTFREKMQWFFS